MHRTRLPIALSALLCWGCGVWAADLLGENLIEAKITLPKDVFLRGATDPVSDLTIDLTLTNRTAKENLNKEVTPVTTVNRFSAEELAEIERKAIAGKMTAEDHAKAVEGKKVLVNQETWPVNKDSIGLAYVEPRLSAGDDVEFVIQKLADEGEAAPEGAKPQIIARDTRVEGPEKGDRSPTRYLAAGETSPVFNLPVGKFYLIRDPGKYSIKAVLRTLGDSGKPSKFAESNEETFRVLPYKVVSEKIADVQGNWQEYERGRPTFDYMLYQCKTAAQWDEIYYVQRIPVRKINRWEWGRLCTVKPGTQVQVAQVSPKKVAILAAQYKGDAGLYTLDFSKTGVTVTSETKQMKDEVTPPKLKVEGGTVSAE
jgi:hypothetical protein